MKRVVILNTYSWLNKGDTAIVLGTVRALRRTFPHVEISIVSATPRIDRPRYAERSILVVGDPLWDVLQTELPPAGRAAKFSMNLVATLLGLAMTRVFGRDLPHPLGSEAGELVRAIAQADLAISCGGGFWVESSRRAIYVHLFEVVCALLGGVPVVCLGQSIGPLPDKWRRWLVGRVLRHTAAVVVRERASLEVARTMRISRGALHLGTDMAFALAPLDDVQPGVSRRNGRMRVGVTARSWLFPGATDRQRAQQEYECALGTGIDMVIERYDAEIVFLPQVINPPNDDDRIVQRRIARSLKHARSATVVEDDFAPEDLVRYIGDLDLVIATRFHSAILSMLAHVPVVAIAYEHKTTGIMDEMGLGYWVLPIERVTGPDLFRLCSELVEQRESVSNYLVGVVKEQERRAQASLQRCLDAVSVRS